MAWVNRRATGWTGKWRKGVRSLSSFLSLTVVIVSGNVASEGGPNGKRQEEKGGRGRGGYKVVGGEAGPREVVEDKKGRWGDFRCVFFWSEVCGVLEQAFFSKLKEL